MYQVYTFPACDKCHKATAMMKERGYEFEEINAASSTGRVKMRDILRNYRDRLTRIEHGALLLPLVIEQGNGEDPRIHQGQEGLLEFLEQK